MATGAVAGSARSASAGVGSTVSGAATCDTETGELTITWTFVNNFSSAVDITSATVDGSTLNVGASLDTVAVFSPSTNIPQQGTASAVTHATGDASPLISMTLIFTPVDSAPVSITGHASPEGGCVAAGAPTTTLAPTTTAPATTALVTTLAPTTTADLSAGSGNLPGTGYHGDTLVLAFALVGAGGVLLLIRRRRVAS